MIRRSLALAFAGFVLYIGIEAQTPVPAPPARPEAQAFTMFFDGDGSYLGIQTEEITRDNVGKYGLKEVRGVAVEKVIEGSPAEKAGIQIGDVIVRFNGEEVTSVRKLTRLLSEVSPDHQAKVTVIRGGSERDLTATVAKRPMPKFEEGNFKWTVPPGEFPKMPDFPQAPKFENTPQWDAMPPGAPEPFVFHTGSSRRLGVGVTTLTKQLSEHFGVTSGVMVNDVKADSPAAKAGLKAGDIIVEIEGNAVKGDGDIIRAIRDKKEGDVSLTFVRNGNRQTIRVTPEKMEGGFNMQFDFPETVTPPQDFKFTMPATPMAPQEFKFTMPATPMPMTDFKFPGRIL
ncbi:MAG TPA: PDZ domain-containing protein [Pyrinomonadaceae bacterium]|nr:PDZ domain-containing protein [Pyrinomonadaceae bacterium]